MKYIPILLFLISSLGLQAQKTRAQLESQALIIKNANVSGSNTPTRVGQMFQDIINSMQNIAPIAIAIGVNNYTISVSPSVTSYLYGDVFLVDFVNTNTTTPATLTIAPLTSKTIKNADGSNVSAGSLKRLTWVGYNGINFQIIGGSSVGSVNTVSGTSNRITSSGGSNPVIDISSNYEASVTAQIDAKVEDNITNGVTDKAPSENSVYDALVLKASTTYVNGMVADAINDGTTTIAPSQNAVFDALANKQATLISATNIKTINGTTLLGSGDLTIAGAGGDLLSTNNLSDLSSASTARTNLGLGTLATQSGTFSGTSSGTNTGDQTTVTGNAGTATALQTARTIGTVTGDATSSGSSFDGSGNNTNALTVTKINGTALSGLATGILKNTTSTGVPSIAVSGTDYQAPLVSGTNIKTINSTSLLGSGNISVSASPGGSDTYVQYNSSGSLAGNNGMKYDATNKILSLRYLKLKNPVATSSFKLIEIPTVNSRSPDTPTNYGSFWHTLYDSTSYAALDGRYDAVYQWGWNHNGSGGNRVTTEAEVHYAIENHYDPSDIGSPQFEVHLESTTNLATGNIKNRHFSMNVNKANGSATMYWKLNSLTYFNTGVDINTATPYMLVDNNGQFDVKGTSAYVGATNTSVTTPGSWRITTDNTGNATLNSYGIGALGFTGTTMTQTVNSIVTTLKANGHVYTNNTNDSGASGIDQNGSGVTTGYNYAFRALRSVTADQYFWNENTNTGTSANAVNIIRSSSSGGSPFQAFQKGSNQYSMGLDRGDASKFKIGTGFGFAGINFLTVTTAGLMGIGGQTAPTALLHVYPGTAANPPMKFTTISLTTTGASGTGSVVTILFGAQSVAPFVVGSTVTIAGVTPSGYNGNFVVTACTTTSVSYANATTGVQTVAGTAGSALLTTPQVGAVEYDGTDFYDTNSTGVRGTRSKVRTIISSAGTLTLAPTYSHYIFSGTTTTWTLPLVSGTTNVQYVIKNRGSGSITLNTTSGNEIYDTSAVSTLTIAAGASATIVSDGTYYNKF